MTITRFFMWLALCVALAAAGCGTVEGPQVPTGSSRVSLTAPKTTQGRKFLADLAGAIVPGQKTLLAAYGAGTEDLKEIVPHDPYLVLELACSGKGDLALEPVGPQAASFPPPPHAEMSCASASLTVTDVTGSQSGTTSQAATQVSEGSVWPAVMGVPLLLQVKASQSTVWAVVVASAKTDH